MLTEVREMCLLKRRPEPKVVAAQEPAAAAAAAPNQQEPETEAPPIQAETLPDAEEEFTAEDLADARDPASFVSFMMSIASNAASALGMMEHPVTHQREVDVDLGKHWIDVLGMLQKKTAGNLTPSGEADARGPARRLADAIRFAGQLAAASEWVFRKRYYWGKMILRNETHLSRYRNLHGSPFNRL